VCVCVCVCAFLAIRRLTRLLVCFLVLRGSLKTFGNFEHVSLFPCVVVCCSVLQCVAVSLFSGICSMSCFFPVSQCVAVCCSV